MTDLVEAVDATPTVVADPGARVVQEPTSVRAVADNFVELMRSFNRAKARLMQATEHDVEWSAHVILRCLKHEGTMRAGSIAECLQTDPSTVSRQVAALVKDGFLERRADPGDGRASLLVLTPRADQVLADHDQRRADYFGHVLEGWSNDDVVSFATYLQRFTTAYEATDDQWLKNRLANRADRQGSTH